MQTSIAHSITAIKPSIEPHQIVLWHILIHNQWRPIPGVIVTVNDDLHIATIKVRTLDGQIRIELVSFDEIEVR